MNALDVAIIPATDTTTINISGKFDYTTVTSMCNRIEEIPNDKPVMVNLASCNAIDPTGLGCLLTLQKRLNKKIKITEINSDLIRDQLHIYGYEKLFDIA